ncbi:MAG: tetratricopeptide repeat protein, partial [Cyclobacteriaceae bacterium]
MRTSIFLLTLIAATSVSGQGFLKKIKKAVETLAPEQTADLADERMKKARLEQLAKDTSNYNYIFSQGNRASFFANREGKENVLLTLGKNYEDEEEGIEAVKLETHEEVFDLNRTGEISIYVKPWVASVNFLEALSLMSSEVAFLNITNLDSAFSIAGLVDMDTLSVEEKYALGKTMANFSILINGQGKIQLSQAFIDETTKYFKEHIGEGSVALASLYNNRAVIAQSQGRYLEAEEYFIKSKNVLMSNGKDESLAHAILTSNRALLQNEIGQFDEARASIQRAQEMASGEIREKGRDNVSFKINEGLIEFSAGDYERSEQIFREVLELKRKRMAKNQTDYANVENYLAGVLMESGKTEEVQEFLNDALRIFESKYGTSHPAYIKTKHNLGKFKIFVGDFDGAAGILQEVSATYLQFFGENHPDYLSSLEDQAVVAWKQGLFSTANQLFQQTIDANLALVEKYFGAMSEYEKGQYWGKVRPSILKFYSYATERGGDDPTLLTRMFNLHLKTKGILLSASTKVREQILQSDDEKLKSTYSKWVETKESLILYYSFSKEQLAKENVDL